MDVIEGHRLSFWTTKYNENDENKSTRLFKNHHLNHAVSIIVPGETNISEDAIHYLESSSYFIIDDLKLEDVIDFTFIEAFIRRGSLTMMSANTRIDADFCFCVLPSGMLVLNVPKEEYESLGLEGKCSNYFLDKQFKYVVQFDLKDPQLTYSSKKFSRLNKFLSDVNKKFKAMVAWFPHDSTISTESIYSYFESKSRLCRRGKFIRNSSLLKKFKSPLLDPERPDLALDECGPEAFYEWLGAVSCECSFGESDAYENTLVHPESVSSPTNCSIYTFRGFFASNNIDQLVSKLRSSTTSREKNIPWMSITVHGFMDAPVSWSSVEHGFEVCGDNNHTLVLFPGKDVAWSFVTHHSLETKF